MYNRVGNAAYNAPNSQIFARKKSYGGMFAEYTTIGFNYDFSTNCQYNLRKQVVDQSLPNIVEVDKCAGQLQCHTFTKEQYN